MLPLDSEKIQRERGENSPKLKELQSYNVTKGAMSRDGSPIRPRGLAQVHPLARIHDDAHDAQGCPRSNCRRYVTRPSKPNVRSRNVEP